MDSTSVYYTVYHIMFARNLENFTYYLGGDHLCTESKLLDFLLDFSGKPKDVFFQSKSLQRVVLEVLSRSVMIWLWSLPLHSLTPHFRRRVMWCLRSDHCWVVGRMERVSWYDNKICAWWMHWVGGNLGFWLIHLCFSSFDWDGKKNSLFLWGVRGPAADGPVLLLNCACRWIFNVKALSLTEYHKTCLSQPHGRDKFQSYWLGTKLKRDLNTCLTTE